MVLDASAVLAYLGDEPGQEMVGRALHNGGGMSVVNLAEVITRYVRMGATEDDLDELRLELPVRIFPFDTDTALEAGRLTRWTARYGLSLGDRCCLATAKLRGLHVLTADRIWQEVGPLIGVDVELIR